MAIDYPSTGLDIEPEDWRPGRDVNSGETAADHEFGLRGLSSQVNFAYGRRAQNLVSQSNNITVAIADTTSTTWVNVTEAVDVYLGQDVADITLEAVVNNADIRLVVDGVSGTGSGITTGAASVSRAPASTGGVVTVQVQVRVVTGTATLYSFTIREDELASGDIP